MKKALLFLAKGFEEVEALTVVDVLRRGGVDVKTVAIGSEPLVEGAHNVPIKADLKLSEANLNDQDALILPGGMPGSSNLFESEELKTALLKQAEEGKIVAAICAAPFILGRLKLLKGKDATCYPGFEKELIGANISQKPAVIDGNIITGKGPGFAFDFALTILEQLRGKDVREEVASGLLLA